MTNILSSSKYKLFLLPFIYYYTLSVAMLILSVYLISKSPNLGVKISLAYSDNKEQPVTGLNYIEEINISASKLESTIVDIDEVNNLSCKEDEARRIDDFFKKQKSPLEGQGCVFSSQAFQNNLNPYLLPAIAMCESTGGKVTPQFGETESFNAFGWAVLDSNDNTRELDGYSCDSWEHCIARVARGIGRKLSRGSEPKDIVQWYNPGSVARANGIPEEATWTKCVTTYMDKIAK